MRAFGAELIEHGRDFDEAREHVEDMAPREGWRYVHSANEPDLIAGVGTYALEIFEDLPDVDYVFVAGRRGQRRRRLLYRADERSDPAPRSSASRRNGPTRLRAPGAEPSVSSASAPTPLRKASPRA